MSMAWVLSIIVISFFYICLRDVPDSVANGTFLLIPNIDIHANDNHGAYKVMGRVTFKINSVEHSVGRELSSDVSLVDYIRNIAELRGTKYMCREGGCGACIVTAVKHPGGTPVAVNSCLVSVFSCQDWDITTIEKVGNRLDGYNALQTTLAEYNGTQCGYCTPGWIMAMYSLQRSKKNLTMHEIEHSFASNICRCTGYRPILEAFKKFATDAPTSFELSDIEELSICKKTGRNCTKNSKCDQEDWCFVTDDGVKPPQITIILLKDGKKWFRVQKVMDVFSILNVEGDDSYMLVAGNTAKGAYPILEYPRILIDISDVPELKGCSMDQNMIIGAGTTITEVMDLFQRKYNEEYFTYLKKLYDHLRLVAHLAVTNVGTIAGNLMIKHQHNEFPSDLFLLFETVGAQLTILSFPGVRKTITMKQFLKENMKRKIILNVLFPPISSEYNLVTYKIMPRAQNAHAVVNAGFLYRFCSNQSRLIGCRLVFGGLSSTFIRASETERYLCEKDLFRNGTLQAAIKILESELIVVENPPEPSAVYRKQLAINLFYKGLLTLCPTDKIGARMRSGVTRLHESRPVSSGKQIYNTDQSLWPLNKPIQKLEALIQCSGEALYTEDLPSFPHEVFAEFVLSTVPIGTIVSIDASMALNEPGVIAFYTAKDIPGINSFTPESGHIFYVTNEEVLCSGQVKYFNQPIGLIVAETRQVAERAAKMVTAKYDNVKKPVIYIKEAKKDASRIQLFTSVDAKTRGTDVVKVVKHENTSHGQYHFSMETLVCVTNPIEEGLEVYASTQWIDGVQLMISRALNMDSNRIDVYVRRLGGAFGIKISRSTQTAVACSLVASKLNRPCRLIQSLPTNLRAVGKRFPCTADFEAGLNSTGMIQYVNINVYEDNGFLCNEKLSMLGVDSFYNCYDNSKWNYKVYDTLTDTAKNTWCRSPGSLESIAMAESFIEQIAYDLSLDPLEVRLANLDQTKYTALKDMVENIKTKAEYSQRRVAVDKFNNENRWKKRGLRFSLLRWTPLGAQYYDVNLSVYHGDGSVVITHSGIEMGQGINTKAAQVCAYMLKIPLDKIKIKGNDTIIAPNGFISGGSLTSQNVTTGVQRCCNELLKRLEPIRSQMNNPTWEELIIKAFDSNVDLQAHGFVGMNDTQDYNIYGVTLAEVELDILTAEFEILRVDLMQDVGQSVSPGIDIGQVEGAFIMGLGYWTCENLVYDTNTGEVLTDRAWHYNVPQAKDIPQDFRIYFRENSYSNDRIFGAKGTGEPSICMSIAVLLAIREAIVAARRESGISASTSYIIDGPYTLERIYFETETKTTDFTYS